MAIRLFQFVYATLRQAVDDPGGPNWLPTALRALDAPGGGRLLPLHEDAWRIADAGPTFQTLLASQWWIVLGNQFQSSQDPRYAHLQEHRPIPCPGSPGCVMTLSAITVLGLENVSLPEMPPAQQTPAGYRTTARLQFGAYTGDGLGPVQVQATYNLTQCVCSAGAQGTTCDGFVPPTTISGGGDISMTLTDLCVDAAIEVQVAGTGAARAIQVTVDQLTARGAQGATPQVVVDDLTIQTEIQLLAGIWEESARSAIGSDDGRQALTDHLNAALNSAEFLGSVGQLVARQLGALLDSNLGPVPAGSLPEVHDAADNPVDAYLFDRTRLAVNNPQSAFYLPRVVLGSSSPVLEPLDAGTLSLGPLGMEQLQLSAVTLTGVTLQGLSNVQAPAAQLQSVPQGLSATLEVGVLSPPPTVVVNRNGASTTVAASPPPLRISGGVTIVLDAAGDTVSGSFTVTAAPAEVQLLMNASGTSPADLQVEFASLALQVALPDLCVTLDLQSVLLQFINQVVNQDSVKQKILDSVNAQLAARRGELGQRASGALRTLIQARLGA